MAANGFEGMAINRAGDRLYRRMGWTALGVIPMALNIEFDFIGREITVGGLAGTVVLAVGADHVNGRALGGVADGRLRRARLAHMRRAAGAGDNQCRF